MARAKAQDPLEGPVDAAARDAYGRLVAWLATRFGNLADAEDALADALVAALRSWPATGVPRNPQGWLLTAARRRLLDARRHDRIITRSADLILELTNDRSEDQMQEAAQALPDERLRLMFVCAHPAIDPAIRAPLMLQCVLGLTAARIASAFLVAPATMGVRLARAKTRIAGSGIPFSLPAASDLPDRTADVLAAIYAAYTLGQDTAAQTDIRPDDLGGEALWLVSLLCRLAPDTAEAHGLFALMLFGLARRGARQDATGQFVPLAHQDMPRWDQALLADARRALQNARRSGTLGRYQLEAAIEAALVQGMQQGGVDWHAIHQLYLGLEKLYPALGVICARIAAFAECGNPAAALQALRSLTDPRLGQYQPYWALQAHLLRATASPGAGEAYARAAALTEDMVLKRWLLARAQQGDGCVT